MPADGQASSGYLLSAGDTRLLLDCGPGVATALSAQDRDTDLSAVVISHLHLDHCYDLLPLGKTLLTYQLRRAGIGYPGPVDRVPAGLPRVPLLVPAGGAAVLDRLAALFPVRSMPLLDRAFELAFEVREYHPGSTVRIGQCSLTFHELRHVVPNCGVRVEAGGTAVAYTGDTGPTDRLLPLADGAGMLLTECTLSEPDPGTHGHLAASDAGRLAARAGAGRLVLTHFSSADAGWLSARAADAARHFTGPISLAAPGRTYRTEEPS